MDHRSGNMQRNLRSIPGPTRSARATGWIGAMVTAALGATVVISPLPATADEAPAAECDRVTAVTAWQYGGSLVRAAAEEALLGTEDAVCAFEAELAGLQAIDERVEANQMLSTGGPAVRAAAQDALDSDDPESVARFLRSGWAGPSATDQRTQVNQMMASGGPQVRAAGQRTLDSDEEGAVAAFLTSGWETPFWMDQRLRVQQILAKAPADSEVARLAQRALDAPDREALTEFLVTDWAIAAARDQERQSIADLTLAAQVAGELAAAQTFAAIEESEIAVAEAAAAKASAEAARQAASAAGDDAAAAARAARSAAEAADNAAAAAQRAVSAAHSASQAARTAASAAARASAAASRAGDEAAEAYEAAGRAATDEQAAQAARIQAERASAAAVGAHAAQERAQLAKQAGDRALEAGWRASSAATNANRAVDAANAAADLASAAGADASQAYAAANRARSSAQRATRAAEAAVTFANQASSAANDAQLAANRAAGHADAAAAAARDAADHAGEAIDAAQRATEYANAAEAAAVASVQAASDAHDIYDAARAADAERIQVAFEQGQAAAIRAAAIVEDMQDTPLFNTPQADRWTARVTQMIALVQDPATPPEEAASAARAVTLEMAQSDGSWIKEGALEALTQDTDVLLEFVREGLAVAAGMDDRSTLAGLMVNGSDAMRAAAQAALDGTDADVAAFLREPAYPERVQEDRLRVNAILADAREAQNITVAEHAQRALDDGSGTALRAFLERDAATAAAADRRIKINQIRVDDASGPELRNAAQVALDGPPGIQVEFLTTARHKAAQADMDAAAHDAVVSALLAQASQSAYDALKDAMEAHEVAATARGAAEEAVGYARDAQESAETADGYAREAQESANEARASADRAAQSARSAASAAQSANESARGAARSALWAQASVAKAAGFADQARESAEQALDAALGAGQNFDAAKRAAQDAFVAAQERAEEELAAWTQTQRNECVRNGGDPQTCNASVEEFLKNPAGTAFTNAGSCPPLIEDFNEELYATCVAHSVQPDALFEQDMNLHMTIAALEIMGAYARALADATLTVGLTALNLTVCRGWCSVVAEGIGLIADPASALDREPVETVLEKLIRRFGVVIIRSKAVNTAAQVEGRSDRSKLSQALLRAHCSPNSSTARATVNNLGDHTQEIPTSYLQSPLSGWTTTGPIHPESLLHTSAGTWTQSTCSITAINDPNDPLSQAAFRHRMETIRIPSAKNLKNIAVARVTGREGLIIATSDKTGHSEQQIINQLRPGEKIEALYSEREPCMESCEPRLAPWLAEGAKISWTVRWNYDIGWEGDIAVMLEIVRPVHNENLRQYLLKALEMSEQQTARVSVAQSQPLQAGVLQAA